MQPVNFEVCMQFIKSSIPVFLLIFTVILGIFGGLYYYGLVHLNVLSPIFSLALAIFAVVVLSKIKKKIVTLSQDKKKNVAIITFSINLLFGVALFVVAIPVLNEFGVPTTSLVTILGTSTLAVGLALKNFLANIAAGIMVVFQKPFEIGDLVEIAGKMGKVDKVDLFSVRLKTASNELVYVPNGKLATDKIINFTTQGQRRIEMKIGISYESNIADAKALIYKVIENDERIMTDPAPLVAVNDLADSAVELVVRIWVKSKDFAAVKFDALESIKTTFDDNGIIIPYPQMNVWLQKS